MPASAFEAVRSPTTGGCKSSCSVELCSELQKWQQDGYSKKQDGGRLSCEQGTQESPPADYYSCLLLHTVPNSTGQSILGLDSEPVHGWHTRHPNRPSPTVRDGDIAWFYPARTGRG